MDTDLTGVGSPVEGLVEQFGTGRWLLVLDNLEQVGEVAHELDTLLTRCSSLAILATSRAQLRLRAEREYPVQPLPLPTDPVDVPVSELATVPAIALFADRARAVRHDFDLNPHNAWAVLQICRRLDGLPLPIELAAARIRLLEPDALLDRLAASLDALGTGPDDLPGDSARCEPQSNGATICSMRPNGRCWTRWLCSSTAGRSKLSPTSPGWTRTEPWI